MKIGFAGLGHLGIISSVVSAAKGCNVVAYGDYFELKNINSDKINIIEPKLNELYLKHKKKIKFTNHIKDLEQSDIIYISKDVHTDNKGNSNLSDIKRVVRKITLFKKKSVLVILSQLPPSFTRKIIWPVNKLYYQVETLVFGNAIQRALKPERTIIGCSNSTVKINIKLKKYLNLFKCPIFKMKYESAELAKVSINMYLISTITTTNVLAEISKKNSANWQEITSALKSDKRIGKYAYLNPGLGIAGGNLERDLKTITKISKSQKIDSKLFELWKNKSVYFRNWALKTFKDVSKNKKKISNISILGLAYKANTNSIKNSPSIMLIDNLKKKYKINVYDPVIKKITDKSINFSRSTFEALKGAEVLFIMTPWKEFKNLSAQVIKKFMKGNIIIDPYRVLNQKKLSKFKFIYLSI